MGGDALARPRQRHDPRRAASRWFCHRAGMQGASSTWCSSGRGAGICSTTNRTTLAAEPRRWPPGPGRAMVEHRYDLQYQLYSLALHRLLALRLPGYDSTGILAGSSISSCAACPRGHFPCQPSRELVLGLDELFSKGVTSGDHRLEKSNKAEA